MAIFAINSDSRSCFFSFFYFNRVLCQKTYWRKKLNKTKNLAGAIAGSMAGLTFSSTLIICHVLSPFFLAIFTPLIVLIDLLACLLTIGIAAAIYKARLIYKYNISEENIK